MNDNNEKVAIRFQPQRSEIAVERGMSVLEAALFGKISIPHKCGGHGTCGTCKVQMESKTELCVPNLLEKRHFTEEKLASGFRLACQCRISGPATVYVMEDPLRRVVRELLEAQKKAEDEITSVASQRDQDEEGKAKFNIEWM
nr:2Fe-2S iron-sulfur cluster binding domain-containing protein [Bacilli bacterium]